MPILFIYFNFNKQHIVILTYALYTLIIGWTGYLLTYREFDWELFFFKCQEYVIYCETWRVHLSHLNSLKVIVNNCLQRIHRVRWSKRIGIKEICAKYKHTKIYIQISIIYIWIIFRKIILMLTVMDADIFRKCLWMELFWSKDQQDFKDLIRIFFEIVYMICHMKVN